MTEPGDDDDVDLAAALDFGYRNESAPDAYADLYTAPTDLPLEGDEEEADPLFNVTNPAGTVSVTTHISGRVQRVDLAANAAAMSETELADEIQLVAELAWKKARSVLHAFVVEGMQRLGHDTVAMSAGLSRDLAMPSQEEAAEAAAAAFARHYATDDGTDDGGQW
ncbi:hypothetical protein [Mycolicibacterium baixiangningiae]|uniref:hypothetical protein n=1 Tax=Mycolicibacterium baixiangningiae TaxID=2761578 RepID=UPI0018D15C7B|nr:hypothetical protein [Mycolicibacterium baixiangningiae]